MGIRFPNEARSFNDKNRCVRFSGYDGMFEVKFYLATDVLACGKAHRHASESDYLTSFDALRPRILKVATSGLLESAIEFHLLKLTGFRLSRLSS
ncbi:DUF1488 domain-containing protein [Aliirhizobium cellulosilyticum]|uniref:DUF1488 domain-containing protein n=1 Tax=Aliirhizobium cellulosilyticum TaxID=393664 RepID=A0A7W6V2R6_9HYPH|nr:DUF1488 domain-containing protein [Rhizobium cellulosilyticum]MBB4351140.1 hypothetical protein [Rhizobium cellulosilyticum]MBB4414284.1 hypothetical protein [Rhizobium cellulosilyticum]MBB4448900.1 hypothetical protein [Rhizobium cellulosilyticum]